MKKIICIFICVAVICLTGTTALAQEAIGMSNELNKIVEDMVGPGNAKGAILSIVSDDHTVLSKGYGFADEHNGFEADGEKTAFRIGSVSKTFVAVAAEILRQEEKLNMNYDISIYLDDNFPKLTYPVTMHHLLTHTAGFEDKVTGMAVFNISDTEPLKKSVRKYLPAQIFKPGEIVSYSNYGIALAAYVIECINQEDFAQYCREEIFLPLGMNRTTFQHMHDIAYVSKPYLTNGEETLEPYMNLYPEGSAVSTAGDMANYMKWLLNKNDNRILTGESKEDMLSRQFTMSEELGGIGYVWNRQVRNNASFYNKKGETLHFYTRIALYPQEQTGIFLSFNTYLPEHKIDMIMDKATDLIYDKESQRGLTTVKDTIRINGYYVNNWSSFETPEKILKYFHPKKMLHISGSQKSGYYINNEKMTLIGANTYSSNIGLLKFLEQGKNIIIATESALTFSKISFWQNRSIQFAIPIIFIVLSLGCFIWNLIRMLMKKKYIPILLICSLVQILTFFILCLLMYNGISNFSLLNYTLYLKICGWFIVTASAFGILHTIYIKTKGRSIYLLPTLWNIAGIIFSFWMFWFNII